MSNVPPALPKIIEGGSVSVNAEPAHRAHGDGMVGEPVPADPSTSFGPGCTVGEESQDGGRGRGRNGDDDGSEDDDSEDGNDN